MTYPADPPTSTSNASPTRGEAVERAVKRWMDQLVDLSGRNRMLFYRTLKRGTLELTDGQEVAVRSLLDDRKQRLTRLLPNTVDDPERVTDSAR